MGIFKRASVRAVAVVAGVGATLAVALPGEAAVPDQTVSGVASAQWQTNNEVDALVVGGGVLYAGGTFTSVRAPGATTSTARTYVAAFRTSTGAATTWKVTLNGRVRALALSPDNATLYLGGDFTTVNGTSRPRLAAVTTATGALRTGFKPALNSRVTALLLNGTRLYAGGDFTAVGAVARTGLAALDAASGALVPAFRADLDTRPSVLAADPGLGRLLVGGRFTTVNGTPQPSIANLDLTTGTPGAWAGQSVGACSYEVRGIAVDRTTHNAYVTSLADPPGCFEGVYKASVADGTVAWADECAGAGQSIVLLKGTLYWASHTHDCGRMENGFVGPRFRDAFVWYRLNALDPATGRFGHWQPNTNAGGTTVVGPHVLATDGTQVFVGGDFTTVNGARQQGLARFAAKGTDAPPSAPPAPSAAGTGAGTVRVSVPGTWDRDSGVLRYEVVREDGTVVGTASRESWAFTIPAMTFVDAAAAPGATVRYRVRATGGTVSAWSAWSDPVVVPAAAPDGVVAATAAVGTPDLRWPLADAAAAQEDASGQGRTATATDVTDVADGVTAGRGALHFSGTAGAVVADAAQPLATSWSTSLWFRSTALRGGPLAGWATGTDGTGASDRVLWLDNDGKVVAALHSDLSNGQTPRPGRPVFTLVRSPRTWTDGLWHHAVATYDGVTLSLYVDGAVAGTAAATVATPPTDGALHVGRVDLSKFYSVFGTNFTGTPAPGNPSLDGDLDEVTTWPAALTADQVRALYVAGASGA